MLALNTATFQAIMPRCSGSKAASQARIVAAVGAALGPVLARYDIATALRAAHFLAQIAHESDGFSTTEEYASGKAYEGRKDLGNVQPGDGVRFKGRGLIQLTGRNNYALYGKRIGVDLVADPARAADPATSLILACEYWQNTAGGLNRFADRDDIVSITRAINGGLNGLDDRKAYLAKAKKVLAASGNPGPAPAPRRPVLREGMRGPAVEALQRALKGCGFELTVDGDFGRGTTSVVKGVQRQNRLPPDGVVGPATWTALDKAKRPAAR